MSNEVSIVKHLNTGYSWSYSLETESMWPVEGSRASDKVVEKRGVAGNAESFDEAVGQLRNAKREVNKL